MMNAIIYVYYRLKKLNPNYGNLIISIQFSFMILVHLLPLVSIVELLFHANLFATFDKLTQDNNVFIRRMIKLPILFSPLFVGVYLFLRKNNERILEGCKMLESMPKEEKRKKNLFLWLYIIGSFAFLILGMTSSGWMPQKPIA